MTKIKDLLFKDKKRKIITICSLVLAAVILLSAILIPAISKINKSFKSEEEMLSYMSGVYVSDCKYAPEYFIFDEQNKFYCDFTEHDFAMYFIEYLKTTKDLETLKNMTFNECINNIENQGVNKRTAEFQYKNGKILYEWGEKTHEIEIKKDSIILYLLSNDEAYRLNKIADYPLACDEMKENFDEAKKDGVQGWNFVPARLKTLKENIKANSKTLPLVNSTSQMSVINDNEDMTMFYLGNCTNANKSSAWLSETDDGIMLFTKDPTISLDDLLSIIDVYLQDYPTYPGASAHKEIKSEIGKGEIKYLSGGTLINSLFELYNVKFEVTYWPYNYPKNNGICDTYQIIVTPAVIEITD